MFAKDFFARNTILWKQQCENSNKFTAIASRIMEQLHTTNQSRQKQPVKSLWTTQPSLRLNEKKKKNLLGWFPSNSVGKCKLPKSKKKNAAS